MTPIQPTAEQREAAELFLSQALEKAYNADFEETYDEFLIASVDALALLLSSREKEAYTKGMNAYAQAYRHITDKEMAFAAYSASQEVLRSVEARLPIVNKEDIGFMSPETPSDPRVAADEAYNFAVDRLRKAAKTACEKFPKPL